MTVAISTDLLCEDCPKVFEGTRNQRHALVNMVRERASEKGWRRAHRGPRFVDLCPSCWLAVEAGISPGEDFS